jgi:hypothetical protein
MIAPRLLVLAAALVSLSPQGSSILGRWRGESVCIKAPWNARCNDEEVVYDFQPSATREGGLILHAFKIVNGTLEPMGDLEFAFDSASRQWRGDFANTRVRIRWIYEVSGSVLTGRVVDLAAGERVSREVRARRDTVAR